MLCLFEVLLCAGADDASLFSDELRAETLLQVMTVNEAVAVGFDGVTGDSERTRFVAVSPDHLRWVEKALERSPEVSSYQIHEVAIG